MKKQSELSKTHSVFLDKTHVAETKITEKTIKMQKKYVIVSIYIVKKHKNIDKNKKIYDIIDIFMSAKSIEGGKRMRKKKMWQSVVSAMLTVAMVFTVAVPTKAVENEKENISTVESPWVSKWNKGDPMTSGKEYQIYPVPQQIKYSDPKQEFEISKEVQVVSGKDIDDATNKHLANVLKKYNRIEKKGKANQKQSKIILGIYGKNDEADKWFKEKKIDANHFAKEDAYALYAKDGEIVILGKDSDAVFYGVSTLEMMFSSFAGKKFYPVEIMDYASIDARGYIEGFYGGWTHEQRKSLMKFAPQAKMNLYVYASKTDSYHTDKWDQLYPENMLNEFKELANLQAETKTEFSWSVHLTKVLNGVTKVDSTYQDRKEKLKKKFDQLYNIGVRRFCILNDDFGSGSNEIVVQLVNDLTKEYINKKGCKPIIYCPQGYNEAWARPAELEAMKKFDKDVLIFWTGKDVNSPFEQSTINYVKEKTGHNPVFWVNYPCNEHAKSGIFLGSSTHYIRDNISGLAGAVSNPIFFAEADKVPLFQLGAYFWNVNGYSKHVEKVWEQCFKYLQPEVYDEYLTIARNVSDCPNSGRIPQGFEESLYLKDTLEKVKNAVEKNTLNAQSEEVKQLFAEFKHMQTAIDSFQKKCENKALVKELSNPGGIENGEGWLQALDNVAKAGESILVAEAELSTKTPDMSKVWKAFSRASKEMNAYNSRTYKFGQSNDRVAAKAGNKRLVPFVNTCLKDVQVELDKWVNVAGEEKKADRIYTNMSSYAKQPLTIAEKEFGVRNLSNITMKKGDYIGVKKEAIAEISSIIVEGENTNGLSLEYSLYGDEWQTAKVGTQSKHLEAKYIRLINKGEGTITVNLKRFSMIVDNLPNKLRFKETNIKEIREGNWNNIVDGNTETFVWTNRAQKVGDYITVDLGETKPIRDITFWTADGNPRIKNADVFISTDNKKFQKIGSFNDNGKVVPPLRSYSANANGQVGRYVRLQVTGEYGYYLKIHEIEVNKGETSHATISPEVAVTNTKGNVQALDDKNLSTLFHVQNVKTGNKLEYRLTDNVNLDSLSVFQGTPCNAEVTLINADHTEKKLGKLTESKQDFNGIEGNVHAIRFDFEQGKDVELNELVLRYGKNPSDDIGVAVENIYVDSTEPEEKPDVEEVVNLALNQKVEVSAVERVKGSGAETSYTGNLSVDGDKNTRWSSGALNDKSYGDIADQWIVLDMGENPVLMKEIQIDFYKKVWPTEYQIQASNDKQNWVTLETITRESANKEGISDKKAFETPLNAKYLRLYFPKEKLNTQAVGGSVSITELTVKGIRKTTPLTYTTVKDTFKEIKVENTATVKELRLPELVQVEMEKASGEKIDVQVFPKWNTEGFDAAKDVTMLLKGELPTGKFLMNNKAVEAVQKVIKGTPVVEDLTAIRNELQSVIDKAQKIVDAAEKDYRLYDVSTINELKTVLEKTKKVLGNAKSTKVELENAKADLDAKILLVRGLDLKTFDQMISQAEQINKDLYTVESVQELESALKVAKELFTKGVTQEDVDRVKNEVEKAYNALEEKVEPEPQPQPEPEPQPQPKPEPQPQPEENQDVSAESKPNDKTQKENKEENTPKTSDTEPIFLFGGMILLSGIVIVRTKRK